MRVSTLLLLTLLIEASAASGFEPAPTAAPSPALAPAAGLDSFYLMQGLGRLAAQDPFGLGAEAQAASAWATGRPSLELRAAAEGFELKAGESSLLLSARLGAALERLRDYMRLSTAARLQAVTTSELRAAVAEPATVARLRELFSQAIAAAVEVGGEALVPELGGDAILLGGSLELREFEDPTRVALRAVAESQDDPEALAALFASKPESLSLLDERGQLEREVALFRERAERGVPLERRRRPFDMAVETILRNGSDTFTMHPRAQLESILSHEWTEGRLVGLWHLHPPSWSPEGFLAAAPPSPDDLQLARVNGQFLTIVFRPDGFDLHDLQTSPLGPAPPRTPERLVDYRSEDWRAHFARLHAEGK